MKKYPRIVEILEEAREFFHDIGENAEDSSPKQRQALRLYNEFEWIIEEHKELAGGRSKSGER